MDTPTNDTNATTGKPTMSPAQLETLQMQKYLYEQYQILQIVYALSYAMMFLLTMSIIMYLRRSRTTALKGDSEAARKVILPSFEPLFVVISCITGTYTLYFIIAAMLSFTKPITWRWFGELLVQGRQFILYLIVVFLMQRSVSRQALIRSILIAFGMAAFPVVLVEVMDLTEQSESTRFIVITLYRTVVMGFFVWLFFYPISRASVRTQRELSLFAFLYYTFVYVYSVFFYQSDYKTGMHVVFCTVVWASFAPFFVWRLLKADTQHWRGMSDRACDFQQLFRENQGIQEIVSAQGLHVLLEMHRKDLIDFAHLDIQRQIGVGASANVYRGVLHSSKQVAVKVYSPSEITQESILHFSQEAVLCSALKHPNIVLFEGMCICPPSICLVYELCRGSLDDALRVTATNNYMEPLWPKICYMLDAARAIAYLHSFSPPFIHRDIKPGNFLLSANNVVKLTDFGEARSMARKVVSEEEIALDERSMTICGTTEYMAPELINGKQSQAVYTETADIYSLAITLWDILHPGREKYPSGNRNLMNIYRMVSDGQRPVIDPEVPQTLHDLLENAWNEDPRFRPSAKMIVATLEDMQENLCGPIAHTLSGVVACNTLPPTRSKKVANTNSAIFSGSSLVRCLIDHEYAIEEEAAVRLGNALMDAGCLHHTKHSMQFENSSETYTFDSYQLELNEPLEEISTIAGGSTMGDPSVFTGASMMGDGATFCDCRRLGQGNVKAKAPRRRLFRQRKEEQNVMLTVNLLNQSGGDLDFMEFSTSKSSNKRTLTMHEP